MKTIKLLTLLIFSFMLTMNNVIAQDNYKAQFPIKIDANGVIKDKSGTTFGTITKDSIIKNNKGEKIAFIDNRGNLVDTNGKILGKADKSGNYHNINGEIELNVRASQGEQCQVFDKSGKVIASVHNGYKTQAACVAHCMETKMLMK